MAKLTNHFQQTSYIIDWLIQYSLDSEDDFRSGCWNVSHQQQFFWELSSPGRSHKMIYLLWTKDKQPNKKKADPW